MLIGIFGQKNHGKDTLAKMLEGHIEKYWGDIASSGAYPVPTRAVVTRRGFAARVYEVVAELMGMTIEEVEMWKGRDIPPPGSNQLMRWILQHTGTELGRQIHPEFWIRQRLDGKPQAFGTVKHVDIVTDGRFFTEMQAIKERGGVNICICDPRKIVETPRHDSEKEMALVYNNLRNLTNYPLVVGDHLPMNLLDYWVTNGSDEERLNLIAGELFQLFKERIFQ